ncbi:MAG: hypothetical protein OHK0029_19440 [Armatimonadaceae bacterium]
MPNRFLFGRAASVATSAAIFALTPVAGIVAPAPVFAAQPVQAMLYRPTRAIPDGANAVRLSIYGDGSGAKLQIRLLAEGQDGVLSGYYGSPVVPVDFEGWKTVTLPLTDFQTNSDANPGFGKNGMERQIAGVVIAVTSPSSRVAVADFGWANTDTSAEGLLSPIPLTNTGNEKWKPIGDFDQMRSVEFAPVTQEGKPALQIVVRSYALTERQKNKTAIDNRLKARPKMPYYVYVRPPFEPIFEQTVPSLEDLRAGNQITIQVSRDEVEPASFAVYSIKPMVGATVKISGAFTAANKKTLPANAVDVRVVRTAEVVNGPQVLMKDDRQPLTGPRPTVRLTGDPITNINAETSKQFWITARIPRTQAPGMYKGKLVFSAPGVDPIGIPVSIHVMDLPLKTAFLQYGIDLRSLITPGEDVPGAVTVTPEQFATQLTNIGDHGINLLMLHETGTDLLAQVQAYKKAGLSLSGPIVVASAPDQESVQAAEGLRSQAALSPSFNIYYQIPETVADDSAGSYASLVRGVGRRALVVTEVDSKNEYQTLSTALNDTRGEVLAPIYTVSSDYAQKLLETGKRDTFNRDYWTWNIPMQSPVRNRLLAGYLIYRTGPGFYGAFPGPYQYVPEGVDPYAAFSPDAATMAQLPQMTAFPVEGGVLDTVQWEAVREGIDDIRYIGVLKTFIRELRDAKKAKAQTDAADAFLAGLINRPLTELTAQQVQNYRALIIKESEKLQGLLRGKPVK